jgi:hypothetical protein
MRKNMGRKGNPNKIVIEGDIAYLYITGRTAQPRIVIIDKDDVPLVKKYRWCTAKTGYNTYIITNIRREDDKGYKTLYLHRLIMAQGEQLEGVKVPDHINGNTLDNRKENLRLISGEVNTSMGRKKKKRSEYRGVTIRYRKVKGTDRRVKRIDATPRIGKGKVLRVACKTERQAALTYDIGCVMYFKDDLLLEQLNFPEFYNDYLEIIEKAA